MRSAICRRCGAMNPTEIAECAACGEALEEEAADPLAGKTIAGRFRIDAPLGSGAMGTVYRATHLALDRGVALKVMHGHLSAAPEFAARFVREARNASKLDHPNSVRVLDFGVTGPEDGSLLYLVMELFVSTDLFDILSSEGALSSVRAGRIISQVLAALEDAHAMGLVHRDIKPENILVAKKPTGEIAKICDFGIAKIAHDQSQELSQAGLAVGTPFYMSPEIAAGGTADARSDLYSVGVMLYEMLSGSRPFQGANPIAVARMHLENPPPPLRERAPDKAISPALEAVVLRALEKNASARWQTAQAFREALDAALGPSASTSSGQRPAMVLCQSCAEPVSSTARFCPECGAPQASAKPANEPTPSGGVRIIGPIGAMGPVVHAPAGRPNLTPAVPIVRDAVSSPEHAGRLSGEFRRISAAEVAQAQIRRTPQQTLVAVVAALAAPDESPDAATLRDRSALLRGAFEAAGAMVVTGVGADLTAYFGLPRAGRTLESVETALLEAVEAALALARAPASAAWFRAGVAMGPFNVEESASGAGLIPASGPRVSGDATRIAADLADAAAVGEVLADDATRAQLPSKWKTTRRAAELHVIEEASRSPREGDAPSFGREHELETVTSAIRAAAIGAGKVVALTGEMGSGKSEIVRAALAAVADLPLRVHRVVCRAKGATPHGLIRELVLTLAGIGPSATVAQIRGLSREQSPLDAVGLPAAERNALVSFLLEPIVIEGRAHAHGLVSEPAEALHREGIAAVRNFLASTVRRGPLAIVIEDMQWIDAPSASLLAPLANAVAHCQAVMLLTSRSVIWNDWNASHVVRVVLPAWSQAAAARAASALLDRGELEPKTASLLIARAGGQPLAFAWAVAALRRTGELRAERGVWALVGEPTLLSAKSQGIPTEADWRAIVESRLRALDGNARRCALLLGVASELEVTELRALAGDGVDVGAALAVLIKERWIEPRASDESGPRRVGFVTEAVREVLGTLVSEERRKPIHQTIATARESAFGSDTAPLFALDEIARHWDLAGESLRFVQRQLEAARSLLARGEANSAAQVARRATDRRATLDAVTTASTMTLIAECCAYTASREAVDAWCAEANKIVVDPATRLWIGVRAERAAAIVASRGGRAAEAPPIFLRALDRALGPSKSLKGRPFELVDVVCDTYLELATVQVELGDAASALKTALAGLDLAGSPPVLTGGRSEGIARARIARLLLLIGRLHATRQDARAADYFNSSTEQAEKAGDASTQVRAITGLAQLAAHRDDFQVASFEAQRALRVAQSAGDRLGQAKLRVTLGNYLLKLGRTKDAESSYRAAQVLAEQMGWADGIGLAKKALDALRAGAHRA